MRDDTWVQINFVGYRTHQYGEGATIDEAVANLREVEVPRPALGKPVDPEPRPWRPELVFPKPHTNQFWHLNTDLPRVYRFNGAGPR